MVAITRDTIDLGELYREHYDLVCRAISRVTRDKELVKDIAHDVFAALPEKIEQYGGHSNLRTWLYSVARNYALDYMKKERKHQEAEPVYGLNGFVKCEDGFIAHQDGSVYGFIELEDESRNPEDMLAYKMRVIRLNRAIQRLEPHEREILELSLRDFEQKEIAEVFGISEDAVKSRLHRVRKSLVDLVSV